MFLSIRNNVDDRKIVCEDYLITINSGESYPTNKRNK